MHKKIHTTAPAHYPVCMHKDCPMAGKCLRQIAYSVLIENQESLNLINPDRCSKNSACRHFRDSTPTRYAKGFKNFQKRMTMEQYAKFVTLMKQEFGHNPYYYRRNGTTLITPQEQHVIHSALHDVGIAEDWDFDQYVNSCRWSD